MPKRRRYQGSRKPRKQSKDSVDRISNLPIEIIREIHSCLPRKDAVKTSILSKKWRSIWASHPEICLDELDFGANYYQYSIRDKQKRDAFLSYLIKSLDSREKPCEYSCPVDELFLRMTIENSSAKMMVSKCISFALEKENNIKILSLSLKTIYRDRYYLRGVAFNATTLLDLTISDCENTNCSFMLPALKSLFLFAVCIEDCDFKDLIAGCPRIEQLRVQETEKLHTIVVSNPNLEFFGVHLPCSDGKIRIESAKLDSLEFISFSMDLCEVEITSTTTVRKLTLRDAWNEETLMHFMNKFPLLEKLEIDGCDVLWEVEITSMPTVRSLMLRNIKDGDLTSGYVKDEYLTLMNFIDKFPLLEKLIIDDCSKLKKLHLSQPNLVSLVLKDSMVEHEVRIDSPKLKSLEYKGGLTDFEGIEALQELEYVMLYFDPLKLRDYYYSWFRDMLESCAHSKRLSLICNIEEEVIIPVEVTDILPVNGIKHLELEITTRYGTFDEVADDFTWIFPDLKTLSLTLGSTTKLIEFE